MSSSVSSIRYGRGFGRWLSTNVVFPSYLRWYKARSSEMMLKRLNWLAPRFKLPRAHALDASLCYSLFSTSTAPGTRWWTVLFLAVRRLSQASDSPVEHYPCRYWVFSEILSYWRTAGYLSLAKFFCRTSVVWSSLPWTWEMKKQNSNIRVFTLADTTNFQKWKQRNRQNVFCFFFPFNNHICVSEHNFYWVTYYCNSERILPSIFSSVESETLHELRVPAHTLC